MRSLAKSLCVSWPSVNALAGQILCVPTLDYDLKERIETFIGDNEDFFNSCSCSVIDENIFQRMKQIFRECIADSNCIIGE